MISCARHSPHVVRLFCELGRICLKSDLAPDHLVSLIVWICNLEVIYYQPPKPLSLVLTSFHLFIYLCIYLFSFPCQAAASGRGSTRPTWVLRSPCPHLFRHTSNKLQATYNISSNPMPQIYLESTKEEQFCCR